MKPPGFEPFQHTPNIPVHYQREFLHEIPPAKRGRDEGRGLNVKYTTEKRQETKWSLLTQVFYC